MVFGRAECGWLCAASRSSASATCPWKQKPESAALHTIVSSSLRREASGAQWPAGAGASAAAHIQPGLLGRSHTCIRRACLQSCMNDAGTPRVKRTHCSSQTQSANLSSPSIDRGLYACGIHRCWLPLLPQLLWTRRQEGTLLCWTSTRAAQACPGCSHRQLQHGVAHQGCYQQRISRSAACNARQPAPRTGKRDPGCRCGPLLCRRLRATLLLLGANAGPAFSFALQTFQFNCWMRCSMCRAAGTQTCPRGQLPHTSALSGAAPVQAAPVPTFRLRAVMEVAQTSYWKYLGLLNVTHPSYTPYQGVVALSAICIAAFVPAQVGGGRAGQGRLAPSTRVLAFAMCVQQPWVERAVHMHAGVRHLERKCKASGGLAIRVRCVPRLAVASAEAGCSSSPLPVAGMLHLHRGAVAAAARLTIVLHAHALPLAFAPVATAFMQKARTGRHCCQSSELHTMCVQGVIKERLGRQQEKRRV